LREKDQDSSGEFYDKIVDADFAFFESADNSKGLFVHTVQVTTYDRDDEAVSGKFEPWLALITVKDEDGSIKMKSKSSKKF